MPTVADQLRAAREARQLTIPQVVEVTKLKSDHIRALEEGNFKAFAAPVYIKGFARTYATLLKLDVRSLLATLDVEIANSGKFKEAPSVQHAGGFVDFVMLQLSRLNWRVLLVLIGAGILIFVFASGYRSNRTQKKTDPFADIAPGLYSPPKNNVGETLPLPTNASAKR